MILERKGNILRDTSACALVNPVNCVGVAKGLALQFRRAWLNNYHSYMSDCRSGLTRVGRVHLFPTGRFYNPKWIINFPTKNDWKDASKLIYIEGGLDALVVQLIIERIESVAIPPLGCGSGGLDWKDVRLLIMDRFAARADITVNLYTPEGESAWT